VITPPFSRLAKVGLQLVMQGLDRCSLLTLARCCQGTLAAALDPFAWRCMPASSLSIDSAQLVAPVQSGLSRHHHIDLQWIPDPSFDTESDVDSTGGGRAVGALGTPCALAGRHPQAGGRTHHGA